MKRLGIVLLAILLATPALIAKKKSNIRGELLNAKFVYVTAYPDSRDSLQINTAGSAAGQIAVADVEAAIRKWGRWTVISTPRQADLIIAVRRGGIVRTGVRVPIGPIELPPRSTTDVGRPRMQAEVGPNEDMIAIYSGTGWGNSNYPQGDVNIDAPPIWRLIEKDALAAPEVPGIKKLRKQIEEEEAEKAKKK